jgi:hypothetical protein
MSADDPSAESGAAKTPRGNALKKLALWALGLFAAAVLGVTIFDESLLKRNLERARWHIEQGTLNGAPSSCGEPEWLRKVKIESASAYTYVEPHVARKSIDEVQDTAWIQPLQEVEKNNYIFWGFGPDLPRIRLVCIRNGWAKDTGTNRNTARLNEIIVQGKRDEKIVCEKSVTLPKRPEGKFGQFESIPFDCEVGRVGVYVESIHPGAESPQQLAISDVRFYE